MRKLLTLWLLILVGCAGQDFQDAAFEPNPAGAPQPGPKNTELVDARFGDAPSNTTGPVDHNGQPVTPRVITTFQGPIPTNDWWTSLLWPYYPGNRFGEFLYADPLAFKAFSDGLALSYPTRLQVTSDGVSFFYPFQEELRVGSPGLNAPDVKVAGHSDWTVTADWGPTLQATIGHGLPFAYFKLNSASIRTNGATEVFYDRNGTLGLLVNGHAYALFAPSGTTWTRGTNLYTNNLGGKSYLSVALLPDSSVATLERFRQSAFTFVTGSKVAWRVIGSRVRTTFTLETTRKEGPPGQPIMALYRHQWRRSNGPFTGDSYRSPRGEMRVVCARSFATNLPYTGVLPNLPDTGRTDPARLRSLVEQIYQEQLRGPLPNKDVYFAGKDLTRLAALVPIAEQVQHPAARDLFLRRIRERLDDFFDGQLPNAFFYNSRWTTVLAQPAGFGSDTQLNDHHFHFGYYVLAAATLARYDRAWATRNLENVEELISDAGNGDRANLRYPFLRNFDPYAGHSWASGNQVFAAGNNQESSSEAMQFATAVVLWANEMNRPALRDLGIYLYATEAEAIEQYWFDINQEALPDDFPHPVLGILWGNGGAYATWWTANPEEIHGINLLPIHGGSLYLGRWPGVIKRHHDHLVQQNRGPEMEWRDILWSALVFAQGQKVLDRWLAENPNPEGGETAAHTYHWLANLAPLGRQIPSVGADTPCFAVLGKGTERSYMAYNAGSELITVRFTDGVSLPVAPGTVAFKTTAETTPTPTPTPTPSSSFHLFLGQSLQATAPATSVLTLPAAGQNRDGRPYLPTVLVSPPLTGRYNGQTTRFELPVDAGRAIATAVQARLSYDFEGDGSWDRIEMWRYFPNDDRDGWESYRESQGLAYADGSWADLRSGRVQLELWSALGLDSTRVQLGSGAQLRLPFAP